MKYYLILVIILFGFAVFMEFKPEPTHTAVATNQTCEFDTYACKVYHLTNLHRESEGLDMLAYSNDAESVAEARAKHLCKTNTFSHDGWTEFLNIDYTKAGENLAIHYLTPQEATQALIDSPTHLENIEGDWTALGVYTEPCNEQDITVQIFVKTE